MDSRRTLKAKKKKTRRWPESRKAILARVTRLLNLLKGRNREVRWWMAQSSSLAKAEQNAYSAINELQEQVRRLVCAHSVELAEAKKEAEARIATLRQEIETLTKSFEECEKGSARNLINLIEARGRIDQLEGAGLLLARALLISNRSVGRADLSQAVKRLEESQRADEEMTALAIALDFFAHANNERVRCQTERISGEADS
jgi:cell fate (sporulation/competence/biofilm development) regulator YmcA (YheA/YmcA/DUF963 family)